MRSAQVRIIGGRWRSRRLRCRAVAGLRPSPGALRETLFNWLGARLPGAACLDLFAGSGALGFEAASRGAASVALVECNRQAVECLRANRAALGAESTVAIFPGRAERFLRGGGETVGDGEVDGLHRHPRSLLSGGGDPHPRHPRSLLSGGGDGDRAGDGEVAGDGDANRDPGRKFDIVFLDPPFTAPALLAFACENLPAHLNPRALVYTESPPAAALPLAANWRIIRQSRRGAVQSTLIQT